MNRVSIGEGSLELPSLLSEYLDLFKDELGTYNAEKVHLELVDKVKPIFHKPRSIPFAFKEKLKQS